MENLVNRLRLWKGIKIGLPVAVGYIPIAITFGLVARTAEIPNQIIILMSFLIYAGASQFIGVNLLIIGASYSEIVFTTFILNLRHFLMSAALSQKMKDDIPIIWRVVLAFGITDETFAISSLQKKKKLSKGFILGLNTIAFLSWNVGTWIGVFFAIALPNLIKLSMGIALYAMFIGLLVPNMKKSRPILIIACLASGLNFLFYNIECLSIFSSGWGTIFSIVISAVIGTFLYPKGEIV